MSKMWSGTDGTGWYYDSNLYKEYVSDKDIYDTIQEIVKTDLKAFTELELIKIASFMLNYQSKRQETSIKQAEALVAEWKSRQI